MDSSRDNDPTQIIFYSEVSSLGLRDLAGASAAIAVAMDYLKDRRSRIAALLQNRIASGEVGDHKLSRSDSGKSLTVEVGDGINLRRTESGGGKKINKQKLTALLEEKGIEEERIMAPTGESIDKDALEKILIEHKIDRELVFKPSGWAIDESILRALVSLKHLTQKELDSVYEDVKPRVSVTCAFDKNTKGQFLDSLKAMEGRVVERGTTSDT